MLAQLSLILALLISLNKSTPAPCHTLHSGHILHGHFSHYKIIKPLINGGCSHVYIANDLQENIVVIKTSIKTRESVISLKKEIEINKMMKGWDFVNLYPVVLSIDSGKDKVKELPWIALPYYVNGDLIDYALAHTGIKLSQLKTVGIDILNALKLIHTNGYIYNDLKLDNLVIDGDTNNFHVRLIDFAFMTKEEEQVTGYGTLDTMAPEKLFNVKRGMYKVSYSADMWSFGIVMFMAYTCKKFLEAKQDDEYQQRDMMYKLLYVETGEKRAKIFYDENFKGVSERIGCTEKSKLQYEMECFEFKQDQDCYCDLLFKLIVFRAQDRLSVDEARMHPFFGIQ